MEPRTAAGRDLLLDHVVWKEDNLRAGILAIEAEARAAALDEARKEVQARYDDLRWCMKDDTCNQSARGAELALSDIDALLEK